MPRRSASAGGCRALSRRRSRGYLVVASTLGSLPAVGVLPRLGIALLRDSVRVLLGSVAYRPAGNRGGASLSRFQAMAVRTAIPAIYVLVLGIVERLAGPGWAGLVSTFPSMSLVVLAVTHLEAGPAEASRIARLLPAGNSSTLAFLAAFHLASTKIGLAGGTIAGYGAALAALLIIERNDRILDFIRSRATHAKEIWRAQIVPRGLAIEVQCRQWVFASDAHPPQSPALPRPQKAAPPRPVRAASRGPGVVRRVSAVARGPREPIPGHLGLDFMGRPMG